MLHLLPTLGVGGMENGVVNLANNIDLSMFSTSICCVLSSGAMADRIRIGQARVMTLGQKAGKAFVLPLKLAYIYKKERADIIHTHNYYAGLYGIPAAKLLGIPVVHGLHGLDYDASTGAVINAKKEGMVCRMADRLSCVSASLEKTATRDFGVDPDKVSLVVNGVDFKSFSVRHQGPAARDELGIEPDSLVIGSVGRLHYQKNYKLLLRAFAELRGYGGLKLILVGDGEERVRLSALAKDLGIHQHVVFAGQRGDIPKMLSVMDIFVLPSFLEGMSNTILEAMCAGLPVVASATGGNPELVEDRMSGLLFESDSLDALTSRLKELITNPGLRSELGSRALNAALGRFSIKAMVERYERLYFELLAACKTSRRKTAVQGGL